MNASGRLKEIVSAMREARLMSAAEWEAKYPFTNDLTYYWARTGSNSWDKKCDAMRVELALRTAEYLLERDRNVL